MDVTYHRNSLVGDDALAYDNFVTNATGTHYLQSSAWAPVALQPNIAQRYIIVREGKRIIGAARLLRRVRGVLRSPSATMERGPVVDDVRDLDHVLPAIAKAARWHGIDRLRIQPYLSGSDADAAVQIAARHGFVEQEDLAGPYTATVRVQLAGVSRDNIFAQREHAELRRDARKATAQGVTVRRGDNRDLRAFADMYEAMMVAQGGNDRSHQYFSAFAPMLETNAAALFLGENRGDLDSAVLVIRHHRQTTFHLGASSATRRPYTKATLPMWRAVEWAHDVGDSYFDLGGVPPAHDDDPKRQNITRFKHTFARHMTTLAPVMYSTPSRSIALARKLVGRVKRLTRIGNYGLVLLGAWLSQVTEIALTA
jgi:lipid II:glycine glycyltransferase (peptidoglycan interpeptide bridge formation enzyme)